MSQLLGLSFDSESSPSITLRPWGSGPRGDQPSGWGFAWYPADDYAVAVLKDPVPTEDTAIHKVLRDWERFRSTVFVCHIRGETPRATQKDTHPFSRTLAGRDWVLAHNGDLRGDYRASLGLGEKPAFEPIGRTDSELAFCWLLERARAAGARRLADIGWPELEGWFGELNALGTANMLVSDGQDLVCYRDRNGYCSLYATRLKPPHAEESLENEVLEVRLDDPMDAGRTVLAIATKPMSATGWVAIPPGTLLVARRGQLVWSNRADLSLDVAARPAPSPVAVAPAVVAPGSTGQLQLQRATDALRGLPPAGALPAILRKHSSYVERQPSRLLSVIHETLYRYEEPVEASAHVIRLFPVEDRDQHVLSCDVTVTPEVPLDVFEDVFGNRAARCEIAEDFTELRFAALSVVRVREEPLPLAPTRRMTIPLVWMPWQRQMMLPYLLPPELPETQLRELSEFAMSFVKRQDFDLVRTLEDLNDTIYRDFRYVSGSTTNETTPFDVYSTRRGVCQDFANLFICLARLLNVPARYRVGYIRTGATASNPIQSEASHAWAEVYLPWIGWRGFDPTNGCIAGLDHVRVATGRNYRDATPTSGTIYKGGGASEKLSIHVRVALADPPPEVS